MHIEPFEVLALRYAHLGNRHPGENFILADPHEFASDLDYFIWIIRRGAASFLVDTGFAQPAADRRRRDLHRNPIPYYFVPWPKWLFGWHPVTVNDAQISVEAAFRPRELEILARRAGLTNPRARAYWPAFRIAMLANVPENGGL